MHLQQAGTLRLLQGHVLDLGFVPPPLAPHARLWPCLALVQVLEDLLAENDGVLDVWHLLGLSYYSGGMLEEAAEVCKAGMQLMKQQQVGPDEGISLAFDDLHSAISEAQAAAQS
jgi:hypothetical protein